MRKRNLALSALILSQALTNLTSPLMASVRDDTSDVKLTSALSIDGRKFDLVVNLHRDNTAKNHYEDFEFQASASLREVLQNSSYIPGDQDGDGNMIFQLKSSEAGKRVYTGIQCSSSFNDCQEFDAGQSFELMYDSQNKSWSACINTTFATLQESEISQVTVDIQDLALREE